MKQLIKKIVKVVPKTMKQIAEGYGISTRVFRGWLTPSFKKKLGARKGHFFNLKQMLMIYERFGYPDSMLPE